MKNLKKVLALVLAFACAFTMFAGAAFTDEADIQSKDAVNMLTALGVIDGYDDGSFQPDGTVTRAEMAKMIFVVRNNTIDDSAYKNISSKLTDISGHWAEGYVKFCESQGIIAGKTETTFDPDAVVTGTEAAKMLLVLAGYEPSKAGLEGSTWATNTLKYAGAAGILDDVGSGLSSGLPRQYAAQMIYNTLDAYRVMWSTDAEAFDYYLNGGAKETVGKAYMGLVYDVGSLLSVDKDSMTIVLNGSYNADNYHKTANYTTVGFTKVGTDYSDLLGQTVKVMFKDGKTNNVLGVFAISDNTAVTINKSAVDVDAKKLNLNGAKYSLDSSVTVYSIADDVAVTSTSSASTFKEAAGSKTANVMTFIDSDGNGNIDFAVERVIDVKKVTSVSSSSIVAGGKTYKFDDHNIDENVVKGDWVAISKNMYDDCMDIVVADKVTGTIDGTKPSTSPYTDVSIDGVWYGTPTGLDTTDIKAGNKVDAYVLNGVLFSATKVSGESGYPDVAMVIAKGTGINRDEAKLLFVDGTTKTVTIDQDDSVDPYNIDSMYEYTVSGDVYTLTNLSNATEYGDHTAYTSPANVTAGSGELLIANKKVADTAKIFLFDDGDDRGKLITGKQFNTMALGELTSGGTGAATTYFTAKVDGLTRVSIAMISVDNASWSTATGDFETNENYGYITANAYQSANGYVTFNMWTGAEYVEGVRVKASNATQYTKGTVLGYSSMTEDKILNDATVIDVTMGAMSSATSSGSTVMLGSNAGAIDEYDVDADTKVLFVNSSADSAEVGVEASLSDLRGYAADDTDGTYFTNAIWNISATPVTGVTVLVIDTTGKFDTGVLKDMNVGVGGNDTTTTLTFPAAKVTVETREGSVMTSGDAVSIGETVQVEVKTAGGYTLTGIKVDDGRTGVQSLAAGTYTFVVTAAGATIA